jgi:hypothetical protein
MSREQLERFVEAVENLARNDLIELAGMWRQDIDMLMATYTKIDEEGLQSERATEAAPNKAAWVSPDPRLLFHLPLDLAVGFVETAKQVLSNDEKSLDSAFGLTRPPGRPVDLNKSKNLGLAEIALMSRLQGKTWPEINKEVFADRVEPPDERYIRTIIDRYKQVVMQKWREDLRRRWLADSEAREKRTIQRNKRKGKGRTPNSG